MRKKVLWGLLCLAIGGAIWPVSYYTLWAMRGTFLGTYAEDRGDCERTLERALTMAQEEDPEAALAAAPELTDNTYCADFLNALAVYRQAIFNRSLGFGLVVALGLLIVRFVMFPFDDSPNWVDEA